MILQTMVHSMDLGRVSSQYDCVIGPFEHVERFRNLKFAHENDFNVCRQHKKVRSREDCHLFQSTIILSLVTINFYSIELYPSNSNQCVLRLRKEKYADKETR